ncbi:MAG: hypothetical protein RJA25_2069, partial [Bacteroidota bacterium]
MKNGSFDSTSPTTTTNARILDTFKKGANLSLSVINGIIGDYLVEDENALAIQMQFYVQEKPITINKETITSVHKNPSSKICILIHGLTNDETIWNYKNTNTENYGTCLQKDFDYTPFYVRYNTGLHISENGKQFSQLIETLILNYPTTIDEIVIIAHSMGGLVTRSACYYAPLQNAHWVEKISKLFFLGTPHLGAPLEKFANALTHLLETVPNAYTKAIGNIINLRSAGIKDLRYGYLVDEDWETQHPDEFLTNNKTVIPILDTVDYFLITGSLTNTPEDLINEWFGDSLVRKKSATGQSKTIHHLDFDLKHHKEINGLTHLGLVYSKQVYEQIKIWITQKTEKENRIESKKTIPFNAKNFPKKYSITKNKTTSILNLSTNGLIGSIEKIEAISKNNITYKILNQIPVVNIVSKEVEAIHNTIQDNILSKSKSTLKKIQKF